MPEHSDAPLVYVIVLNYDGRRHLEYCLPSIKGTSYPNCTILLVDNHSTDDSLDFVREHHPDIEILESERNLGWAGGNNLGIRCALERGAAYIILANNDIRVHPQWVGVAVQAAEGESRVGIVGFHVFGAMTPGRIEDFHAACEAWSKPGWQAIEFVHGMALFVAADVFMNIGLIDEAFFVYGEENDFELRACAAGYRMVETNVPVWHYSQGYFSRFSKVPVRVSYLAMSNSLRYSIKNHSLYGIARQCLILLHIACNPFFRGDMTNVCIGRIRSRNIVLNAGVLFWACVSNLIHLHQTLAARAADQRRVRETRRRLDDDRPCAE